MQLHAEIQKNEVDQSEIEVTSHIRKMMIRDGDRRHNEVEMVTVNTQYQLAPFILRAWIQWSDRHLDSQPYRDRLPDRS